MSWFEDQILYRKEKDDESFSEAFDSMAAAIMGKRFFDACNSSTTAKSAVEEILKFFHIKPKTDEISEDIDGVDGYIEYLMRPYGIMRRCVYLDEGWYKHAVGPMLATVKDTDMVVALIPDKISGYSYYDYSTEKRVKLNRKSEKLLDKEAICFYTPLPQKSLKMTDLFVFMFRQLSVSDLVLYVGLMGASAALGLLMPMFTKWMFGIVLQSKSTRMLIALATFMVSYLVCQLFLGTYQSLINSRVNTKQEIAVEAAVMSRIMSLPPKFFRNYSSGELSQRSSYVQSLCSTLFSSIGMTGLTSVFSLIYIGQIFAFAPSLVVPSIIITLCTLVISTVTTLMQMKITKQSMEVSSKVNGMTYSMITGIQKIKLAGAQKRMFARWAKLYSKQLTFAYNPPAILKLSGTFSLLVNLAGTLILYSLAIKTHLSVEDYYAFTSSYGMVSGAFGSVAMIALTIANIKPTLEMAKPIMETVPENCANVRPVKSLTGAIEINNLSFRYDESMPYVIENLSLKVKPGEYLAIVGATGCGKSTLLRLLLGFERPDKGSIYYDRKDLSKLDVKSVRRNIGVVMQDGGLFQGDIYSNIVISAPELSLDRAWEAAEIAAIADDIRNMPMGMNTIISEGQGGISGGQRQRLMIARAVVNKPKILMFDEATSALDNLTQKKVSEAIDSLKCTRIVIAHRLSTIRHCNRIIVLDKGKVAEEGTYDELIALNGLFAELVKRQRIDADVE